MSGRETHKSTAQTNSVVSSQSSIDATLKDSEQPWSVFSQREKHFIVGLAALAGIFSPLSASIYFPAIQTLAHDFGKTTSEINLTVTVYMIFQGIVPAFFTDLAEDLGKRPVYLLTFIIYIGANIGLALQNSYGALMGLRCLQSSGSSVTVALAISSASDVAKGSERGRYVGLTTAGLLFAPAVGPVIGGLLAGSIGWRAIFWFLTICSGVFVVIYFLIGQESARSVVGNGSIPPPKLNQSVYQMITLARRNTDPEAQPATDLPKKSTWHIPNPTRTLLIFKEKDLAIILLYGGLVFAAMYQMTASTVTIFQETYGYSDTIIGVCYIPMGIGSILGSVGGGRVLDLVVKRYADERNYDVDRRDTSEESLSFPWARARIVVIVPFAIMTAVFLICYGWVVQARTSVAAPLVFQFFFSVCAVMATTAVGVMLVDSYPAKSATASAANNISRCLLGAGATAVIEPMLDAMGRGWCFTFVALVLVLATAALWPVWKYGGQWRRERMLRDGNGM